MAKLLYVVTEDRAFVSHFLPMVRVAKAAGFEIVVATRVRDLGPRIEAEGCRVVALETERRSLSPWQALRDLLRIARLVRAERPDIVHCIQLRMIMLGGLGARLGGTRRLVLAPTGLGHLWIHNGPLERAGRALVRFVMWWLAGSDTRYLFENTGDPREFGLDPDRPPVTIVPGAGVDPSQFAPSPEPSAPPVKVGVVARMIVPKGIAEAVAAVRRARSLGAAVELNLYGAPDPSNRRSCSEAELRQWGSEPGITWHGPIADVRDVWRDNHIAMLLSYREGAPLSLIEAAACGRPIITTDTPGCRDVVRDGAEGRLVPVRESEAAAHALVELCRDADLRQRMGRAARARFLERYTEQAVQRVVAAVYASFQL